MLQVLLGLLVFAVGIASNAGFIPVLAGYTYPILWWGLLVVVDRWNQRTQGLSLWSGRMRHFFAVTIPVSVLFWLLFELLNLGSPQWHYRGALHDIYTQSFFGFIAFATVIPIMVEAYWLVGGAFCLPAGFSALFRKLPLIWITIGVLLAVVPFVNHRFWWNQGMWLAPALVLLPFHRVRTCGSAARFTFAVFASGLLGGFFWELLNYSSRTHWEYLILTGTPHLFQMPLIGYIGFIPFALTAMIVYEQQLRLRASVLTAILLYGTALASLYVLTEIYNQRGLWLNN